MTKQRHFKRRIRERMRKTGESYTTARLHLLGHLHKPAPEETEATSALRSHPKLVRLRGRRPRRSVGRPLSLHFVTPAFTILLSLILGLTAVAMARGDASSAVSPSVRAEARQP